MKIHREIIRRAPAIACMLALLLGIVMSSVWAGEYSSRVSIPVRQVVDGSNIPDDIVSRYRLEGIGDAPMPADYDGTVLRLKGNGSGAFGEIVFERPEVYSYRVTREPVTARGYTADECTYEVVVAALADGDVKIVCKRDDADGKADEVVFHDRYKVKKPGLAPETGDSAKLLVLLVSVIAFSSIALFGLLRKHDA